MLFRLILETMNTLYSKNYTRRIAHVEMQDQHLNQELVNDAPWAKSPACVGK